jgi:tRNA-dihydrouridine synthase
MNSKLMIGSLKLENPYFLAPMAGVNDIAFRILCKRAGAGLVYTGMINPLSKKNLGLEDKPAVQIFSANEKGIGEFIEKYDDDAKLFDFNLGCSKHIARRSGFGAFLQNKKENVEKILKIMRDSTKKPITVKLRKSNEISRIIRIAEKYCDAIAIHPRTIAQGYSGKADVGFAEKLKKKTSLPVIYSGDANEKNANDLLKKFDFVMIGREATGYPNIFAKLTGNKGRFGFDDYLALAMKYNIGFEQIKMQAIHFTKFMEGGSELRLDLSKAKRLKDIERIYKSIFR